MAAPNIPNSVQVHAACYINAGNPPTLRDGSANIASIVRNGAGDYTLTMGSGAGLNNRTVKLTVVGAVGLAVVATETDTDIQIVIVDAGNNPVDTIDCYLEVGVHSVP